MSIDEAYLDLSARCQAEDADASLLLCAPMARQLKGRIRSERGLTATIGIASNKLLAKIASDFEKPDGLTVVSERDKVQFLRPLPARALFGVGRVTEQVLLGAGIRCGVGGSMLRGRRHLLDCPLITGMKSPNQPAAPNAAIASRLTIGHHWPGVPEPERSAANVELHISRGIAGFQCRAWHVLGGSDPISAKRVAQSLAPGVLTQVLPGGRIARKVLSECNGSGQHPPIMISPVVTRRSFLKTATVFSIGAPLLTASGASSRAGAKRPLIAYVGTFSSPLRDVPATQVDLPPGNGKGIHLFRVDRATGALRPIGVQEMGTSPSCLVLNAAGTRLYSANETDRQGERKEGTVSAFAVNQTDGQLNLLGAVGSGGAGPTYVSVHPSGRFVLVANYFGGSVAVLPIRPDGSLGPATDIKQDVGKVGPARATNSPLGSFAFSGHDHPHAHMIQADAAGRFVLHADLGLDLIFVWKFDDRTGLLTPNDPPAVALPPGDGPRHFHFHANGRWLYSLQEEGSTIVLFDYDAARGRLTERQTISSLPPGYAGSSFGSEILGSRDGRFVYAGNRLHDSIAIFAVGKTGELTFIGEEWTRGNYPRSFNFDPTGSYLYSCNQRADNLTAFHVHRRSGRLAFTGHYTPVGNPSIIVFIDLDISVRESQWGEVKCQLFRCDPIGSLGRASPMPACA